MENTNMPVISAKDLNLWYGDFKALKGISLDVGEREITALIGPSGCGKSTFLKTLNRMNDLVPNVRIVGESAALLFTAGAAEVIAKSVAKAYTSNGATLSVLLYLRAFEDGDFASAWGIGAVLLVLVLAINLAARLAKTKLKQKQ